VFVILIACSHLALAQQGAYIGLQWAPETEQEFLVRFDPYTGTVSPIRHIPHVRTIHSSAIFNTEKGHYIFTGSDSSRVDYYFVLDAQTGELLSRMPKLDQINCMAYDPNGDRYFGVWWDGSDSTEYFVSFDPFTAEMTLIDSIPGVMRVNSATPLVRNGRYVLCASDRDMKSGYYVIDVETGTTLSIAPISSRISAPEYDADNDIYSLMFFDTVASAAQLVHVDPMSATTDFIVHLPEFHGIQGGTTPSEPGRYVFKAMGHDGINYHVVLDLTTGQTLAKVPFNPQAPWINGVVYHAKYLPNNATSEDGLHIYPNPTADNATIAVPSWGSEAHRLRMFDASGRMVREWSNIASRTVSVDGSGLSSGVYMLQFLDGKGQVTFGKLSIQHISVH